MGNNKKCKIKNIYNSNQRIKKTIIRILFSGLLKKLFTL